MSPEVRGNGWNTHALSGQKCAEPLTRWAAGEAGLDGGQVPLHLRLRAAAPAPSTPCPGTVTEGGVRVRVRGAIYKTLSVKSLSAQEVVAGEIWIITYPFPSPRTCVSILKNLNHRILMKPIVPIENEQFRINQAKSITKV